MEQNLLRFLFSIDRFMVNDRVGLFNFGWDRVFGTVGQDAALQAEFTAFRKHCNDKGLFQSLLNCILDKVEDNTFGYTLHDLAKLVDSPDSSFEHFKSFIESVCTNSEKFLAKETEINLLAALVHSPPVRTVLVRVFSQFLLRFYKKDELEQMLRRFDDAMNAEMVRSAVPLGEESYTKWFRCDSSTDIVCAFYPKDAQPPDTCINSERLRGFLFGGSRLSRLFTRTWDAVLDKVSQDTEGNLKNAFEKFIGVCNDRDLIKSVLACILARVPETAGLVEMIAFVEFPDQPTSLLSRFVLFTEQICTDKIWRKIFTNHHLRVPLNAFRTMLSLPSVQNCLLITFLRELLLFYKLDALKALLEQFNDELNRTQRKTGLSTPTSTSPKHKRPATNRPDALTKCNICGCTLNEEAKQQALAGIGGHYRCCPYTFTYPPVASLTFGDPLQKICPNCGDWLWEGGLCPNACLSLGSFVPVQNCENCGELAEMYGEDGCADCCIRAGRLVPRSEDFNYKTFLATQKMARSYIARPVTDPNYGLATAVAIKTPGEQGRTSQDYSFRSLVEAAKGLQLGKNKKK